MWVLKKANDLWRDWKSTLCCGVCDKYQTNAERIAAIPKYVRKEDWQKFVEMCSMPEFIARRQLGKAARREMKNPHTSGRKGQARVADELVSMILGFGIVSHLIYYEFGIFNFTITLLRALQICFLHF